MQFLLILTSIGALVCWIKEILAAFKYEESPLLGILSIIPCFGLGGFIIGWINVGKWNLSKVMYIWTAIVVLHLIIGASTGAFTSFSLPQMN